MTLTQIREEIVLVKDQIAASGGVAGKSIDGTSVSFAVSELYRRLQYLEELEVRMLASRRTVRTIDLSNSVSPRSDSSPPLGGHGIRRPMTEQEVSDLVSSVFSEK